MSTVSNVKMSFESVLSVRDDIVCVFGILDNKITTLKEIYESIVKTHNNKHENPFGIDSFYFQNQLIETDYKNLQSIFIDIDNRVYCEYYNLYKIIKDYAEKNVYIEKVKRSVNFSMQFEPYKHLDSTKKYCIVDVREMHDAITACISELESYLTAREAELVKDDAQSRQGLNIDNLVHTEMYNNIIIKAKIQMFYQYLGVFNTHHTKYYTQLLLKTKLHSGIVNQDISIKQFGGKHTRSEEITNSGLTNNHTADIIDEDENAQIKTLIDYEDLPSGRQSALDTIISSSGSSSNSDSESNETHDEVDNVIVSVFHDY